MQIRCIVFLASAKIPEREVELSAVVMTIWLYVGFQSGGFQFETFG